MHLLFDTALMAPVRGWLARAERLLDGRGETPAHAWFAVVRTYERMLTGDLPGARQWARRAIEVGSTCDPAACAIGRVAEARLLILDGDVQQGLALLDEAGVATVSGDLDPLSTGVVYCELVCALQGLAQYDVAEEWTEAMERWCETNAIGSLHGRCRVHRAEILRLRGSCNEAERQALMACEELRPYLRRELGWPLERARTDPHCTRETSPARRKPCWPLIAPGGIPNRVSRWCVWPKETRPPRPPPSETPSSAPCGCPPRSGHRTPTCSARRCSRRRSRSRSPPATSAGPDRPPTSWSSSPPDSRARRWSPAPPSLAEGCGSPTATRRARNSPCPKRCDSGTKSAPRTRRRSHAWASPRPTPPAAASTGPSWSARRPARSSTGSQAAPSMAPPAHVEHHDALDEQPAASVNVFRREGDYWSVIFDGQTVHVRDLKGMRYLARLLADPGREYHVLDLVAAETGSAAQADSGQAADLPRSALGDAGEMLDARAKDAYRRRLAEIDDDIEQARATGDTERAAQADAERDFLVRELSRAFGLGGRDRRAASASERARAGVTRAIRQAMTRIGEHHPQLGEHLNRTIRTGTYCAYLPDPRAPAGWTS